MVKKASCFYVTKKQVIANVNGSINTVLGCFNGTLRPYCPKPQLTMSVIHYLSMSGRVVRADGKLFEIK